jgi:hypothetical protein
VSKQFFITGFPRSQTAWLSNLLTWGDSICYHDPVDLVGVDIGDFGLNVIKKMRLSAGPIGLSDSSTLYVWREFVKAFPDAKWVAIDRHPNSVIESLKNIIPSFDEEMVWEIGKMFHEFKQEVRPQIIPFPITYERCMAISEYLEIDIGPGARVRQLCDMNIQIHPPVLKARLEALKVQQIVAPRMEVA